MTTCRGVELIRIDSLKKCKFVRRINRFVLEAKDDNETSVYIHNNNTGRLLDILYPGNQIFCIKRNTPGRTKYSLVGSSQYGGSLINTVLQEKAFMISVQENLLPWLNNCKVAKRAPSFNKTRLDFEITCGNTPIYVETKSAVLKGVNNEALYPDCPTERGRKHIALLGELAKNKIPVYLVFIAGFPNATYFTPNDQGDPKIRHLIRSAIRIGLKVRSIGVCLDISDSMGVIRLYNPDMKIVI